MCGFALTWVVFSSYLVFLTFSVQLLIRSLMGTVWALARHLIVGEYAGGVIRTAIFPEHIEFSMVLQLEDLRRLMVSVLKLPPVMLLLLK